MAVSASERPTTNSKDKSDNSPFRNDTVILDVVEKFMHRVFFTSALCVIIGCSVDRDPVPLDTSTPLGLDGSDGSDADIPNRENPQDSAIVPSPDTSLPDDAGIPDTSALEASTREASTLDGSIREASTRDSSTRDASIRDTSIGDEAKTDSSPPKDAEQPKGCDMRGIYGGKLTVEAWWGGRTIGELVSIVDAGRDTIRLDILFSIDAIESDGTMSGTGKACNIELPPFYSTLVCESYQPVFPVQAWNSASNPVFAVSGKAECTDPGCTLHFDTVSAMLGVKLNDPFGDWPQAAETLSLSCADGTGSDCFPDHDDDGHPGITVDLLTEGIAPTASPCPWAESGNYDYRAAPISFNLAILVDWTVPRTDRIHLGARAKIGGDIAIEDDCNGARGSAVAEGFDSRAISCYLKEGTPTGDIDGTIADENTPCTSDNRQFMDENLPIYNCLKKGEVPPEDLIVVSDYSPSDGPKMSLVKLGEIGDSITCEDVRNANY